MEGMENLEANLLLDLVAMGPMLREELDREAAEQTMIVQMVAMELRVLQTEWAGEEEEALMLINPHAGEEKTEETQGTGLTMPVVVVAAVAIRVPFQTELGESPGMEALVVAVVLPERGMWVVLEIMAGLEDLVVVVGVDKAAVLAERVVTLQVLLG